MVLAYVWYLPFARKVLLKCIACKIPYFVNCDGAFIDNNRSIKSLIKNIGKIFYIKNAKMCLASGIYAANYFRHYGARDNKISIHNFSSLHRDDIIPGPVDNSTKDELRKSLGIKNIKTVISVGQFIPRKGFDILLEAWEEIDEHAQLVIVGGGKERSKYEKMIAEKKYRNVILHDFLDKNKIFEYYKASDVFVLPTREDIWGLVINEAMACGLPVITTDHCVAGLELVKNGKGGYIVPIEDSKALNDCMKQCLNADLYEMGMHNIEVINDYTIERIIERHINDIHLFGVR